MHSILKVLSYDKNFLAPYLVENRYEANKNMFVFNWEHVIAFAWQLKNFEIYLNSLVDHLEDVDPTDIDIVNEYEDGNEIQFNLVTHSAGGLVSRYYIENLMADGVQIDKLITVNTPHWGSNDKHNTGAFGVLIDIDRDDSPLLYSDPDIRESPEVSESKLRNTKALKPGYAENERNTDKTDYYFIGGLVAREDTFGKDTIYYPEGMEPTLFTLKRSTKDNTDKELYKDMKSYLAEILN